MRAGRLLLTFFWPVTGGVLAILIIAGGAEALRRTGTGSAGLAPFAMAAALAAAAAALAAAPLRTRAVSHAVHRWTRVAAKLSAPFVLILAAIHALALERIAARLQTGPLSPSADGAGGSAFTPWADLLVPLQMIAPPIFAAVFAAATRTRRGSARALGSILAGAAIAIAFVTGGNALLPIAPRAAAILLFALAGLLGLMLLWHRPRHAGSGPSPNAAREGVAPGGGFFPRRVHTRGEDGALVGLLLAGGAIGFLLFGDLLRVASLVAGSGSRTRALFAIVVLVSGAFGLLAGPRALRRSPGPWRLLGMCLAVGGIAAIVTTIATDLLPSAYLGMLARAGSGPNGETAAVLTVIAIGVLAPALFCGAALGAACAWRGVERAVLPCALGIAAGAWAPSLAAAAGLQTSLVLAAALLAMSGALCALLEREPILGRAIRALVIVAACGLLLARLEPWQPRFLTASVSQAPSLWLDAEGPRLGERLSHDRVLDYRDGATRSAAVRLVEGRLPVLFADGRLQPLEGIEDRRAQEMAAHLPAMLGPDSGRALVLAAAPAATVEGLLGHRGWSAEIASRDPVVASVAAGAADLLVGSRARAAAAGTAELGSARSLPRVLACDARRALAADREGYDAILSPPIASEEDLEAIFDPITLASIRARLRPGGIASLSLPLRSLTMPGVLQGIALFRDAFPDGTLWIAGSHLFLIGGAARVVPDIGAIGPRSREGAVASRLAAVGLDDPLKVLALQAGPVAGIPGDASGAAAGMGRAFRSARLVTPLGETLAWISARLSSSDAEIRYPDWWREEARAAVGARLKVLREAQRHDIAAHAALAAGLAEEAAATAERAMVLDPSDVEARALASRARALMGDAALERGDHAAARAHYESAIAQDPACVEALTPLAWIRYTDGSKRDAESLVRRALAAAPWIADLHYRLGLLRFEEGDLLEAESELRRSFDLDPRRPEALVLLGDVARRRGDRSRAEDLYRRALGLGGRVAETRTALAALSLEAGRLDDATREIDEALDDKPADPEALFTRARIRAAGGDREGARLDLLSAVRTGGPPYRSRVMGDALLRGLILEGKPDAASTAEGK